MMRGVSQAALSIARRDHGDELATVVDRELGEHVAQMAS
jgi:hypothetical protein